MIRMRWLALALVCAATTAVSAQATKQDSTKRKIKVATARAAHDTKVATAKAAHDTKVATVKAAHDTKVATVKAVRAVKGAAKKGSTKKP